MEENSTVSSHEGFVIEQKVQIKKTVWFDKEEYLQLH